MGKKKKRTTKRKNKAKNRAGAKKGSKKREKKKANEKKKLCPLQIRIVELIEVITHNGTEYSVKGPAKKPRKPPKTIQGNIKRKDKNKGAYKQYINLDNKVEKSKAHPEYGRCVRLKARIEWVDKNKKDSLAGKKVYWSSKAGRGNKAGLTGSEKENFYSSEITMLGSPRYSESDKDGWTKVVEFKFSQYGGDKYRIFVQADENDQGKPSGKKLRTGWYVVWRKLWYEVDTMKKRGGGLLEMNHTKLPAIFKPTWTELELQGKDNNPGNKWNLQTSELHDFANHYFGSGRSPYQAHEVGIDHQADKKDSKITFSLKSATGSGHEDTYYVYDGGNSWLKNAKYKDGIAWKNLDKSKVSLVKTKDIQNKVKVDLSKGPVTPSNAKPVEIELEIVLAKEWSGDGANNPHALVAMGYWYDTETVAEAKKEHLVRWHTN